MNNYVSHAKTHDFASAPALDISRIVQVAMRHKTMFFLVAMAMVGFSVWPVIHHNLGYVNHMLVEFRAYCRTYPFEGQMIFVGLFAFTLFLGLPLSTLLMMLIGLTYNFGEAVMLVLVCRMAVAIAAFMIARHAKNNNPYGKAELPFPKTFKDHPALGLALMRLAPLPDSVVSYGMGATRMPLTQYVAVSLLAMAPITVALVWMGKGLGSISHLIQVLV